MKNREKFTHYFKFKYFYDLSGIFAKKTSQKQNIYIKLNELLSIIVLNLISICLSDYPSILSVYQYSSIYKI